MTAILSDVGVEKLRFRAKAATICLGIYAVSSLLLDLTTWLAPPGSALETTLLPIVALISTAALIAAVVFVAMWTHRANKNLRDHGADLEYTPGWAVGWYFIPFANLVKPFHAAREIWNASIHGAGVRSDESDPLLTRWWATWIVGSIVSNAGVRLEGKISPDPLLGINVLGSVLLAIAAYSLFEIISAVTRAQMDRLGMSDVFA